MFFVGAGNLLLAMAWWAAWLGALRWPPHEDETLVFFVSRQPLGDRVFFRPHPI